MYVARVFQVRIQRYRRSKFPSKHGGFTETITLYVLCYQDNEAISLSMVVVNSEISKKLFNIAVMMLYLGYTQQKVEYFDLQQTLKTPAFHLPIS